jgi:hypothetical protein
MWHARIRNDLFGGFAVLFLWLKRRKDGTLRDMRHRLRLSIAPGSVIAAACVVDHYNGEAVFKMSVVSEVYNTPLGGSEPFVAVVRLLLMMIGTW